MDIGKTGYCLMTNDVETTSIWHNELRDSTGERVLKEGMPLLLEAYDKYNVKATFFFTGYIAKKFPEVVRAVIPYGHEIACHGLSHDPAQAFDVLSFKQQCEHLTRAKELIEDIGGTSVITFRAPALRVNSDTARALELTGFRIDSSISSQRFDMFLSFGNLMKLKWITAPRKAYFTQGDNLFRKGNGSILEVPVSAMILPYIGTTLRIAPGLISLLRRMLAMESGFTKKPIVFLTHPNEFIDERHEAAVSKRRASGFFSYILGDVIRRNLKIRNLGLAAKPLLDREIYFWHKRGYIFCSIKDYAKMEGYID